MRQVGQMLVSWGKILYPMGILENAKQEVFAQELAKGATKTQAAKTAGYSERVAHVTGSKLSRKPHIVERVHELKSRGASLAVAATGISEQAVLNALWDVVTSQRGKPGSVKAAELIGRELGLFDKTIPIETFHIMMYRMGEVVVEVVKDQALCDLIAEKWKSIRLTHPMLRTDPVIDLPASAVDPAVEPGLNPSESESDS